MGTEAGTIPIQSGMNYPIVKVEYYRTGPWSTREDYSKGQLVQPGPGRQGYADDHLGKANLVRQKNAIKNLNETWTVERVKKAAKNLYPDEELDDILMNRVKRRKINAHLTKYGEGLVESEARIEGRKQRSITLQETDIDAVRKNLVKNNKKVAMVNNRFIFADPKLQEAFIDDMMLRYQHPKTSIKARQAGVLSNKQIFKKYFEGTYSEKGVHDLINRFKTELGFEFKKLPPGERNADDLRRAAKLLISQAGKRISGLETFPAHHLFPIGDEFAHGTQDFAIIDKKTNSQLSGPNKKLVYLAEDRTQLVSEVSSGKISVKEFDKASAKLDAQAESIINNHYKKYPKHDGLLNWRKAGLTLDDQGRYMNITVKGTLGGDASKWSITNLDKSIKDLSKTELATFRGEIKQTALKKFKPPSGGQAIYSFPANLPAMWKTLGSGARKALGLATGLGSEVVFFYWDKANEMSKGKTEEEAVGIAANNATFGIYPNKKYLPELKKVAEDMGINPQAFEKVYFLNENMAKVQKQHAVYQERIESLEASEGNPEKKARAVAHMKKRYAEWQAAMKPEIEKWSEDVAGQIAISKTKLPKPTLDQIKEARYDITDVDWLKPFAEIQMVGEEKLKREKERAYDVQSKLADPESGEKYKWITNWFTPTENFLDRRTTGQEKQRLIDDMLAFDPKELYRYNLYERGISPDSPVSKEALENLQYEHPGLGLGYAGGGIAGIRRPWAIPPESGPDPQGLASLNNYATKRTG